MKTTEELTMSAFQIIAYVGEARSLYIEAIHAAKEGDFDRAEQLMKKGGDIFLEGHTVHTVLVQEEAAGDAIAMTLMLAHAEDQLMSAEGFQIVASEMVDLCRRIGIKPLS